MYLLRIIMLNFLLKPLFGELFYIGVRLITTATKMEHKSPCSLLAGMVPELWKVGGFRSCISMPPVGAAFNWRILPYKVTVESSIILGSPRKSKQFELFDIINRRLNPSNERCSTLVGSFWWTPEEEKDTNYDIRMFINIARLDAERSACSILSEKAKGVTPNVSILMECRSDVIGLQGSVLTHPVILKLKTHGHHLLQSESVYKSIKFITSKINGENDHCVIVTKVLTAEFGRSRDIIMQFKNASVTNDSCTLLLGSRMSAYFYGAFVNCETFYINSNYSEMGIRMVMLSTGSQFHGMPVITIGETELALRTELLFNLDAEGCITYEPSHVARLLCKTKERLSAFISAPPSLDLCEEVMKRMGGDFFSMYKSCSPEMRNSSKAPGQNVVLYRLAAREPFHAVDAPFYLNYHTLLVNNLNSAHSSCLYNGYIDTQPTESN